MSARGVNILRPSAAAASLWWSLWRLAAYRPWLYLLSSLFIFAFYLFPLAPGLIARAFLDALSAGAPAGVTPWGLLALLVGLSLARAMSMIVGITTEVAVNLIMLEMFRRNVLCQVIW
jgi:hypothetical protein